MQRRVSYRISGQLDNSTARPIIASSPGPACLGNPLSGWLQLMIMLGGCVCVCVCPNDMSILHTYKQLLLSLLYLLMPSWERT